MRQLLFAASVFALSTGSATAQDAAYDWSGFYIGVQAGYDWGKSDVAYASPILTGVSAHDPRGGLAGAYAGYNHHFSNNLVLGVDADIAWTTADSSFKALLPYRNSFGAVDIDYTAAIRTRVGFSLDRFLPYIAGGLAVSRAKFSYDMTQEDAIISSTLTGWTLGAGLDYAASDNLILRGEYRYSDFGNGRQNAFPAFPADQGRYDLQNQDLRLGIAYKF